MEILRSKETGSIDAELSAIRRLVASLEPLSKNARLRVLQYALAHLGIDSETVVQVFVASSDLDKLKKPKVEDPSLPVPLH